MKKLILKKTCVVLQSSAVMKERNAALLLLLTSFIWGLSFVAQSVSSDLVGPFTFNSIRLLIGGIVLVPFAIPSIRKGMHDPGYWKKTLKAGIVCGLLLAAASVTQQIGVGYSGAGKGGFITSVYIIIVPFISLIFGKKVEKKTWIAGLVALIGMYLLCMGGKNTISVGDIYLILCALLFSFHIMAIDALGKDVDGITMSMLQFFVGGIVTFPGMVAEGPAISTVLSAWMPILYAGAFSCGIAYTLQVVGQKYVQPSHAVLILSLESVWAAIGGVVILSERMSASETIGCILVFAAVLATELDFPVKKKKNVKITDSH